MKDTVKREVDKSNLKDTIRGEITIFLIDISNSFNRKKEDSSEQNFFDYSIQHLKKYLENKNLNYGKVVYAYPIKSNSHSPKSLIASINLNDKRYMKKSRENGETILQRARRKRENRDIDTLVLKEREIFNKNIDHYAKKWSGKINESTMSTDICGAFNKSLIMFDTDNEINQKLFVYTDMFGNHFFNCRNGFPNLENVSITIYMPTDSAYDKKKTNTEIALRGKSKSIEILPFDVLIK